MSFSLRKGASNFKRFIYSVLWCLNFIFAYIDELSVASVDRKEHLKHLDIVFQRLADGVLAIEADKCQFGRQVVEYLSHLVSTNSCRLQPLKVSVSPSCEPPISRPLFYRPLRWNIHPLRTPHQGCVSAIKTIRKTA